MAQKKVNAVIHSQEKPYRRFVFWISREYLSQLLELSPAYGYLIQHMEITGAFSFHNDVVTFNAIQSKVIRLLEEVHGDQFGREAQVSLCVNDLILYLNTKAKALVTMGMPMSILKESNIFDRIISVKYDVPNDRLDMFDDYRKEVDRFYDEVLEKNA